MPTDSLALTKVRVPMPIVLGKYELLTNEELDDHINDVLAELRRRRDTPTTDDD